MENAIKDTDPRIAQFWARYLAVLETFRIPDRSRPWYRKHVQGFIDAHSGSRLRDHTPELVVQWLESEGRRNDLEDWQFRQKSDALRLLFCHLLRPAWAAEFDWNHWMEGSRSLGNDHPTVARSYERAAEDAANPRNRLAGRHPEIYRRFLTTMRMSDLAFNTERSYLDWINRFLRFHENRPLDECSEAECASFLEYLVLQRKVAASTQSQALNALVFFFAKVLERPLGEIGTYARSKRPRRIPTVLSRQREVKGQFSHCSIPSRTKRRTVARCDNARTGPLRYGA